MSAPILASNAHRDRLIFVPFSKNAKKFVRAVSRSPLSGKIGADKNRLAELLLLIRNRRIFVRANFFRIGGPHKTRGQFFCVTCIDGSPFCPFYASSLTGTAFMGPPLCMIFHVFGIVLGPLYAEMKAKSVAFHLMSRRPLAVTGLLYPLRSLYLTVSLSPGLPLRRASLIHGLRPPAQTGFHADVDPCRGPPALSGFPSVYFRASRLDGLPVILTVFFHGASRFAGLPLYTD